jgi:predicted permease
MKLALMPAVAYGLVRLLGLDGLPAQAAVLETAMPPMITASALAISHRLAPGLAAALAGYGVVLALVTVPLWRLLI